MKFSSTVPMVRPLSSCTFMADSLTMVPIERRWRMAAMRFVITYRPSRSTTLLYSG